LGLIVDKVGQDIPNKKSWLRQCLSGPGRAVGAVCVRLSAFPVNDF